MSLLHQLDLGRETLTRASAREPHVAHEVQQFLGDHARSNRAWQVVLFAAADDLGSQVLGGHGADLANQPLTEHATQSADDVTAEVALGFQDVEHAVHRLGHGKILPVGC